MPRRRSKPCSIDSWYDPYLGVVVLVRVVDGLLKKGMRIKLMSTGAAHPVDRVGIFRPKQEMLDILGPGEVGFFTAAIKEVADTRVGDTVTEEKRPAAEGSSWLQACPASGVLRSVPRRCFAIRGFA